MRKLERDDVARAIGAITQPHDRLLVVHCSLIHLGVAPDQLKWAVLAPLVALSRKGATIAVPAFTFSFCSKGRIDMQSAPSETGRLADWVLELEGAVRTSDPIYSFAAIGPEAARLAACRCSTTFGDDSPFAIFEERDARIVMLGADWSFCTQFHRSEERARVPYRAFKTFAGLVTAGGQQRETNARMFVRDEEIGARNDFTPAITRLRSDGCIRATTLGAGDIESVSCRDFTKACDGLLADDPLALVSDRPRVQAAISHQKQRAASDPLRLAILGNANLEHLRRALISSAKEHLPSHQIDMFVPSFGQAWQAVLDSRHSLYDFAPALTFFVDRLEDVIGVGRLEDAIDDAESVLAKVRDYLGLIGKFVDRGAGRIVVNRFARLRPPVLGSADEQGTRSLIARANALLDERLGSNRRITLLDVGDIAAWHDGPAFDERLWYLGRFPFSHRFAAALARRYAGMTLAAIGKTARLLVIDLDNTIWGGVLGEDGREGLALGGDWPGNAYLDFQKALVRLSERGVAIAICSKNDEAAALEVLRSHPEMVLKQSHITTHRINWLPKWKNVTEIAEELDLGLANIAVIDDSPVEREQIRRQLPEVTVVDLPDDPALFASTVLDHPMLECLEVTAEDRKRVRSYRGRAALTHERRNFDDPAAFYASLKTRLHLRPLTNDNLARAVQLMTKTNQFNTTTRRYDAEALQRLAKAGDSEVIVVGLEDRFTELENIGIAVLRKDGTSGASLVIDDLLLSCRVLGRGVESALIDWIIERAKSQGARAVRGSIIETSRNTPVRSVFSDYGFVSDGDGQTWSFDVIGAQRHAPWAVIVDEQLARETPNA